MKIFVLDEYGPEAVAMMQALYSRSPASIEQHIASVEERGAEKFMEQYYVGYGHKSIGDCGTTTLCVEGVSMFAAKMIQSSALYNGQEASTRYQDFLTLHEDPCVVPAHFSDEDAEVVRKTQQALLALYKDAYEDMKRRFESKLRLQSGNKDGELTARAKRAIQAAACDVAGSILPVGTKTNLSWHVNLRQGYDHTTSILRASEYGEIATIGGDIYEALKQKYGSSFPDETISAHLYHEQTASMNTADSQFIKTFVGVCRSNHAKNQKNHSVYADTSSYHRDFAEILLQQCGTSRRGKCVMLPRALDACGVLRMYHTGLDFRSFRDLHRHRGCHIPVPGPNASWKRTSPYYEEALAFQKPSINDQLEAIMSGAEKLRRRNPEAWFYCMPMGYTTPFVITGSLRQLVYLAEIRSSPNVHVTARQLARGIGACIEQIHPTLFMHLPENVSGYFLNLGRGDQTIFKKTGEAV